MTASPDFGAASSIESQIPFSFQGVSVIAGLMIELH